MKKWISLIMLSTLLLPACTPKTTGTASNLPGGTMIDTTNGSGYNNIDTGIPERSAEESTYYAQAAQKLQAAFERDISNSTEFHRLGAQLKDQDYQLWYDIMRPCMDDALCQSADLRFFATGFLNYLHKANLDKQCTHLVAVLKEIQKYSTQQTKIPQDLREFLKFEGTGIARINLFISVRVSDTKRQLNANIKTFNESLIKLYDSTQGNTSAKYLLECIVAAQTATQVVTEGLDIEVPYTFVLTSIMAELSERISDENIAAVLPTDNANEAQNSATAAAEENMPPADADTSPSTNSPDVNQAPISADPHKIAEIQAREAEAAMKGQASGGVNQAPISADPHKIAENKAKEAQASQKAKATTASKTKATAGSKEQSLPSGLKYTITKAGSGKACKKGDLVRVHYIGKLQNGMTFDSSYEGGEPLEFALGQGIVIDGWEQGLVGMKVGEERHLVIPPALGYGKDGNGPIPPNATLLFDIALLDVK